MIDFKGIMKENFEIDPKIKKTLITIIITLVIGFFTFTSGILTNEPLSTSFKDEILEIELENEIVKMKFNDESNHGVTSYSFEESDFILNSLPSNWNRIIEEGDTIYKKETSLIFLLKKIDGRKITLNYQECLDQIDRDGYFD